MEYAKDEIFKVRYNATLNRLEIHEEGWTSKLWKRIKKHKFMTTVFFTFILFSSINFLLIHHFMKILQTI